MAGDTDKAVRAQLDRILASHTFAHSERLRSLLRFVVEKTLDGHASELKETVIAFEVCGRLASFDPKADPIVRVDANRLRSRLQTYYETEGSADPVRLGLSKGSYVPTFEFSRSAESSSSERAIAVLPFVNLGSISEQEYFSDSLTEQLIHRLSLLSGLRVIARGSAFQFKGRSIDVRSVGRQLGVDYVLEGTVRVVDARLRITVQMSDVRTSYVLWSDRYERLWSGVLDIEEEIAASVTDALRVRLDSRAAAVLNHSTENADAYAHYLRGRYLWNQRTPESLEASLRAYEQATEIDPGFAAAYAGITETLLVMALNDQIPTLSATPRARAAARRAVELQPASADALVSLAAAKAIFDWDWEGSERDLQRALQIHPGSATGHYLYAILVLQPHGRWTEAFREMNIALQLDPVSPVLLRDCGMLHFMRRDWAAAEETYRKLEESAPGFRGALYWRSRLAIEQGRFAEALQLLESRIAAGRANARVRATAAYAWARSGHPERARAIANDLLEAHGGIGIPPLDAAMIAIGLERHGEAVEWLAKACEQRAAPLYQFGVDPLYDPIRSYTGAESVRRSLGLPPVITCP